MTFEQPAATFAAPTAAGTRSRPVGQTQGAWAVWFLCGITCGIYYWIWYERVNRELMAFAPEINPDDASCHWWSQILPIFNIISLFKTAERVNNTAQLAGSQRELSPVVACLLAPIWFGSQTRYIQRRLNAIWETAGSSAA